MRKSVIALAAGAAVVAGTTHAQEWYDTMKLKGDVRYRYESIDDETKDDVQQRDRLRLRAGVTAKVNPDVDAGFRLTSSGFENGSGDPISGNQTLTGGGSKKAIFIDLAYIDYHPSETIKGLNLIVGKMENPFYRVADNVWDNDYTPEGLAAKYKVGDELQFQANAGYHWIEERASGDDAFQTAGQALVRYGTDDDNYGLAGVGYYGTENLEGKNVIDNQGKSRSFGNSTAKSVSGSTTNTVYASEFNVVEAFAEAGANIGLPAKVYGSYTQNQDADDEDTGYIVGLLFGRCKDPKTFEFGYNYRSLEKNAVLGCLTDSDAGGGGTNYEGHKIHGGYAFAKNWQVNLSYFMDNKDPDGKDTSYDRLQVDLVAKF